MTKKVKAMSGCSGAIQHRLTDSPEKKTQESKKWK